MYHFIVNPKSRTGTALEIWKQLEAVLIEKKISYKTYFTEAVGHATTLARAICSNYRGMKRIIVVGGDGTVNEAINGFGPYKEILFGYIPCGSSNDLARGLGIPTDPMKALALVLHPQAYRMIDHGILTYHDGTEPHRFAVSTGMGYDATICYEALTSGLKTFLNKLKLGKLTYILIAVKQIFTNKPREATIIIDGTIRKHTKKLLFIASLIQKCEGGGLPMAPKAKNDDRKLSVCYVHDTPKWKIFILMPTILFAKHSIIKGVELFDCSRIEVITDQPTVLHTDGEYAGTKDHVCVSCTEEQIKMML